MTGSAGSRGAEAERLAAAFLQGRGLRLLETNYRCRFGEIDLILKDRGTLVFVEVRLRQNPRFGGAVASITADKRRRLLHTAQHYLQRLAPTPPCRFDVVLLGSLADGEPEWIRDAFGAE